jgi:hypothetical protein
MWLLAAAMHMPAGIQATGLNRNHTGSQLVDHASVLQPSVTSQAAEPEVLNFIFECIF